MNALQAQRTRRNEAIGMGAVPGAGGNLTAPPPPTSTYWTPVPNPTSFWMVALKRPNFKSAYQASTERATVGTTRRVLWRSWNDSGTWYATARTGSLDTPKLFQYNRPSHTGAAGGPSIQGLGDLHARLAQYMDDQGMLDVTSFGYDPGVGSTATENPTLQKWAQLPVLPNPNDPKWTALPPASLEVLRGQVGWEPTVVSAQAHGQSMFKYKGIWYQIRSGGFAYLAGGSGRGSRPGLSGMGVNMGVGATDPLFTPPSSAERAANPPGDALASASSDLMVYLLNTGVPSEHISDPNVSSWQATFNSDPISSLHAHGKLQVDGGYGPNTQAALASIVGSTTPAVNTNPAPSGPATPSTPSTPSTTVVVASGATNYTPWLIGGALVAGAGILTAAVMHHKKKNRKYRVVASSRALTA